MRYIHLVWLISRFELRQIGTYRTDLILRMLSIPINLGVLVGVWWALMPDDAKARNGVFSYLVAVTILSRLLNLSRIALVTGHKIQSGNLAENIVRLLPLWCEVAARSLAQTGISLAVVVPLALTLMRWRPGPEEASFGSLACYLFLGLVLQFLLYYMVGLASFWIDEIRGILVGVGLVQSLLGGSIVPLEYMPSCVVQVLSYTPLPYMFYVPARHMLGLGTSALFRPWVPIAWVMALACASYSMYRAGHRRYTVAGI